MARLEYLRAPLMNYRILGSQIEYIKAAKRLEELAHARPGTPEAAERRELIYCFRKFEDEIHKTLPQDIENNQNKQKK